MQADTKRKRLEKVDAQKMTLPSIQAPTVLAHSLPTSSITEHSPLPQRLTHSVSIRARLVRQAQRTQPSPSAIQSFNIGGRVRGQTAIGVNLAVCLPIHTPLSMESQSPREQRTEGTKACVQMKTRMSRVRIQ